MDGSTLADLCVGSWAALMTYKAFICKEKPMRKQVNSGNPGGDQLQPDFPAWQPWPTVPQDDRKVLAVWANESVRIVRWNGSRILGASQDPLPVYWMPLPSAPPPATTPAEAIQWLEDHKQEYLLAPYGDLWQIQRTIPPDWATRPTPPEVRINPSRTIIGAVQNAMVATGTMPGDARG